MRVKKENIDKVYASLEQFGISTYKNGYSIFESAKSIKIPKSIALYIESAHKIKSVKSKKYSNTTYTLENSNDYYYLTREIKDDMTSLSSIVLSADHINSIKNASNPTNSELVSLGDRLNDEGAFGL